MASQYDAIFKTIMSDPKSAFVEAITSISGGQALPNDAGWFTGRTVDYFSKVNDKLYVHIEIQTKVDDTMHWRMVNYYTLLNHKVHQWERDDITIKQFVIHIGPETNTMRETHPNFGAPYQYRSVNLKLHPSERLDRSAFLGDRILGLLLSGKGKDAWEELTRAVCVMQNEPRRMESLFYLLQLSGLRGMRKMVENIIDEMGMYEALQQTPLTARAAEHASVGTIADLISDYYVDEGFAALSDEERNILTDMRLAKIKVLHKAITRQGAPRASIVAGAILQDDGNRPKI